MLLFLFVLFPVSLVLFCLWSRERRFLPVILAGMLAASLTVLFKVFFTYAHRVVPYSFAENFAYYFLRLTVLPLGLLYGIYFLVTRDELDFKLSAFFPLTAAFYAVYLPYTVASASEFFFTGYSILLKPVVYLALLVQLSFSIKAAVACVRGRKTLFAVLNIVITLVYFIFPAVSDALYSVASGFALIIVLDLIYAAYPAFNMVLALARRLKKS